jgi:benzoyl-CoA reductase/2-hydroxyglutaryl-CoA dehydratase subunit BcrC/BadD/HgdB
MNDIPQTLAQMKNRGRHLLGCFPLYPPLELIHSFGLTPVVLWGMRAAVQNYDSSDRHLQNYTCRVARCLTGFIIDQGADLFDALFMYNACDTLRNLPEVIGAETALPVFRLHVPALPEDRTGAQGYLQDRIRSLVTDLEQFTHRPFSADIFAASTGLYRKQRALCRSLDRLCAAGGIPFARAAEVLESAHVLSVEDHIAVLEHELAHPDPPAGSPGARVMVSGIQAPPAALMEVMEDSGITVAANDIATLARSYAEGPPPQPDPALYYRDFYFHHYPCSTMLPAGDRRVEVLMQLVEDNDIRGFIFFGEKFCEYEYFEFPHLQDRLKDRGVATLFLETGAEDPANLMPMKTRIEAFAEMLRR